jgi:hypothetical protein
VGVYDEIANLILGRVPRKNGMVAGVITEDRGLRNGTQIVGVYTGGATREAAYLAPFALQVPGNCLVQRAGPELTAGLIVPLTNYQVPVAGLTNGLTTGGQALTTGGQVLTTGV